MNNYIKLFLLFAILIAINSCSINPKPINFGVDDCDYCKMTISDERYGAELVTKKGRVYKFDDLHCLKGFIDDEIVTSENTHSLWIVDFSNPQTLIEAEKSFLLQNDQLQSPMGSNTAAFSSQDNLDEYYSKYKGKKLKWEEFVSTHH